MSRKTSVFENGMIWFGAAVGLGCVLLFLAGYIGGKTRSSAMETVTFSFGKKGGYFFALLNVLQLVGWTAIMIYDGSLAANGVFRIGSGMWAVVIGGLILVWILIGIQSLGKLNVIAMSALFILTIILSVQVFGGGSAPAASSDAMTFGAAIELNVAMPLSWVPLISDYTREAEKPAAATLCSTIVYGLVSCWMYTIGMGAAIFAGTDQLAIGAMIYLREKGLMVPKDISICGANDMDYSSLPWFDLTTTSLNRMEMGRAAAQMLLDIIEKRQTHPENLLLGTTIIVRGSTRSIKPKNKGK